MVCLFLSHKFQKTHIIMKRSYVLDNTIRLLRVILIIGVVFVHHNITGGYTLEGYDKGQP